MTTEDLILETSRLHLRKLRSGDFKALCGILQDIEVMYAWEHAFSDSEVADWIEENLLRYERDGYSYWAAIEKTSGLLIGVCGIIAEEANGSKYTGIGYIFSKAHWHKGYAFECASACAAYALQVLGITELTAQIRPENAPSRKLAEKLGMTVKCEFIKRYSGRDMPHLLYGMQKLKV